MRRALALVAAAALALPGTAGCGRQGGPPSAAPTGTAASPSGTPTSPSGTPTGPTASATPGPSRPAPPPTTGPARPAPTRTGAAPTFPPSLAGRDLDRIPTNQPVVALTFDAGANADGVASILATLDREGVRGTFFLTGAFVRQFPSATRSIAAAGHRLGNHTDSHPHLPALSDAQVRDQMLGAERAIVATTGRQPRPFFRFPYGDRTAHTIALVNAQGYLPVRWTVDTLGWQGTSAGRSAASVTARVLDAARPGEIVLMHVGSHPKDHSTLDATALPAVITGLRQRGYRFVTLDALLTTAG